MLWHRSWAITCLFCFQLDFLWLSKGEKTFRITTNKCKTFWNAQRQCWLQSSLLTLCGPETAPVFTDVFLTYIPVYYCTFSKLSCSSFHCLLSYLSIIWEHCIVIIRLMLIHSLPSFLSYLAWLHFRSCRKVFVGLKKFFLAIIFCTFRFLVLLDRKCLLCHLPHMELRQQKKSELHFRVKPKSQI